jgi:hypothetical protein
LNFCLILQGAWNLSLRWNNQGNIFENNRLVYGSSIGGAGGRGKATFGESGKKRAGLISLNF